MPIFQWNDRYSVGISQIDIHHKELVSLINQLHESMLAGKSKIEMGTILDRLVEYTQFHFGAEEKFMAANAYPNFETHKQKHILLANEVITFQDQFHAGKTGLSLQLITFLKDWLTNHIQVEDKKLGAFLATKGQK